MSDSVMRVRLQSDQVSLLMDLADSRLAAFAIRFMSDNEVEIQRAQANQIREELGAEPHRAVRLTNFACCFGFVFCFAILGFAIVDIFCVCF